MRAGDDHAPTTWGGLLLWCTYCGILFVRIFVEAVLRPALKPGVSACYVIARLVPSMASPVSALFLNIITAWYRALSSMSRGKKALTKLARRRCRRSRRTGGPSTQRRPMVRPSAAVYTYLPEPPGRVLSSDGARRRLLCNHRILPPRQRLHLGLGLPCRTRDVFNADAMVRVHNHGDSHVDHHRVPLWPARRREFGRRRGPHRIDDVVWRPQRRTCSQLQV